MRAALLAAVLAMSCRYTLDERDAPKQCSTRDDIAICVEADDHSDFAWLQDNVFQSNCSGDSCHNAPKMGQPPGGRISLTAGLAYTTLMGSNSEGVMSEIATTRKLVEPGKPNQSYLFFLLRGIYAEEGEPPFEAPPDDVGYMPQKMAPLCCQKLEAVRRWIEAGALDD
jgi:hypothetical protein